jgi:preprotein translocase SecF subunit
LKEIDLEESVVQTEKSSGKEFLTIRSAPGTSDRIEKLLDEKFPVAKFRVEQNDKVGKLVGDELARNSLIALGLGIIGIFIYVTARFEFAFALAAIIALLHDVILTIGAFALFGRELSLIIVGAVLTIVGYSINDTIVVFDRIREGMRTRNAVSLQFIMNRAINETLGRTILTDGTTVLSTLALYFLGGPVLHDFAFTILVGILVGTYSSIFVASPIVLWWSRWTGKKHRESQPETALAVR